MNDAFFHLLVGAVLTILIGGFAVLIRVDKVSELRHTRAIKVSAAHYDTKTGDFTWDDEKVRYIITGKR